MKKRFLKFIVFLLGFLGISTISAGCMYGGIPTSYKISGNVVDKETSQAINNIQIELFPYIDVYASSDVNGKWEIITPKEYRDCGSCKLSVKDIDGEANGGEFIEQTVTLSLIETESNVYEQHNILIEMEKLPPEKN
jgi:hypothetical protein